MSNVWKTKARRVSVIVLMILAFYFLFLTFSRSPKPTSDAADQNLLTGDTLYCTIVTDSKLTPGKPALKFATDLIRQFSMNNHCIVDISVEKPALRNWEDLSDNLTDIIVFNSAIDSIPSVFKDYIATSAAIEKDYICAMRSDDKAIINNINFWISHIKPTSDYKRLYAKLHRKGGGPSFSLPMKYSISPFDNLAKQYSATIGWDWRLLSALMYKESGFNMDIVSSMGAVGLMQVLQSVANSMGVENIYDPEQNIRAGCKILGKLHSKYRASGMDEENALLFTLASYNAGEGRIQQCQKVAKAENKNPNVWADVASVIPLMANGYENNGVSVKPFRGGAQTMNYPSRVMSQYEIYRQTVEE